MGKALVSSKPKKNTEENRRKRKNPKSRKRRRVSYPPSSSSSDTDDVSPRRRNSRRKPEIRRGRDRKRSVKKSRKARHRSVSSMSRDSSSSCSTCRSHGSLNRSRSTLRGRDDRKGKLKKKSIRGRKLDRIVRSLRSRNRSLSCSTCSGSSGSSQTYSNRDVKNKDRNGSRQIGSSSVIEEERYGSRGREIDNEMIVTNCDDSQFSHANVGRDVEIVKEDEGFYEQGAETDRWMSESNVGNELYFDQSRWILTSEPYIELDFNTKLSNRIKSEIVVADKHDSESDDLELVLRQKALENLKKLRSRLSSDNRAADDKRNELSGIESSEKSSETATKLVSLPKSPSTVSKELHIQLGVLPLIDPKVKPVIDSPSLDVNYSSSDKKTVVTLLNQNRQSPYGFSQEKNASEARGSGSNSLISEVNLGDGKEKIRQINETVGECQSGSQFEQKTFSRMHDGEMVQVSYKVYIPNKTPALARRKLQR